MQGTNKQSGALHAVLGEALCCGWLFFKLFTYEHLELSVCVCVISFWINKGQIVKTKQNENGQVIKNLKLKKENIH